VEGIEGTDPDWWLVGVQWHPEVFELSEPGSGELFRDFIGAAVGA
jgi:gamma-glutamyl-gamma-aminobutyrate hydrolase PuuD